MTSTAPAQARRPGISHVADLAGWALVLLSLVVFTGYALGLSALESFVPTSAEMKANAAAAIMLAAIALLRRNHRDMPLYAALVFLIGALTHAEYLWNANYGIDELLFRDPHYIYYPGRMSQYVSLGCMLLGSALLPMMSRHGWLRELSRILAFLTGALGALALVSSSYDLHSRGLIRPEANVAIPTAIGFVIAAIGIHYANPREGIARLLHADDAGGAMLRRLLPAGLLISLLLGFLVSNAEKQYRWETGFSLALVAAGVAACLITIVVLTAAGLEREDLARRESEQRFRLVANSAPVMIWMSATDRRCVYVNEPWLRFTGRSLETQLGDGWKEAIHPEDRRACIATLTNAVDRREPFQMQYRVKRHDGEYRWVLDTGVPRFTEGVFAGYTGSCIDITERKTTEEAFADLERRLLKAQEEERSRIARELHDDINQRIAILISEVRSLQKDGPEARPRMRSSAAAIVEQLGKIGTDIHAISRRLHSSHLEYLGLATAAAVLCKDLRAQHQVEIDFQCIGLPANLPKDVSLCLYRVLQEALHNAIKHSGARQFSVELVGSETEVRLAVNDQGAGFDPARVENQQGLGMISMRERVRMAHGEFAVESAPGRGATVRCTVPTTV